MTRLVDSDHEFGKGHHPPDPAGLFQETVEPFQAGTLHPLRCPFHFAGKHIKAAAQPDPECRLQSAAVIPEPVFLFGRSQCCKQDVRSRRIDGFDNGS